MNSIKFLKENTKKVAPSIITDIATYWDTTHKGKPISDKIAVDVVKQFIEYKANEVALAHTTTIRDSLIIINDWFDLPKKDRPAYDQYFSNQEGGNTLEGMVTRHARDIVRTICMDEFDKHWKECRKLLIEHVFSQM